MININCLLEKGVITAEQAALLGQILSLSKRELFAFLLITNLPETSPLFLNGEQLTLNGEPLYL